MEKFKGFLVDAGSFYSRNMWITFFCVIFLLFTTYVAFFGGLVGICYNLFLISTLFAVILVFRLGCVNRILFDVEDLFTCIFHVLRMDLHHYMEKTEYYEINDKSQLSTFVYRFLLLGAFVGSSIGFMTLFESFDMQAKAIHPMWALVWGVSFISVNVAMTVFIEKRISQFDSNS